MGRVKKGEKNKIIDGKLYRYCSRCKVYLPIEKFLYSTGKLHGETYCHKCKKEYEAERKRRLLAGSIELYQEVKIEQKEPDKELIEKIAIKQQRLLRKPGGWRI